MDYSRVMADATTGTKIGRLYMEAKSEPSDRIVRAAYSVFAEQVRRQFQGLENHGIRVIFQDTDPYTTYRGLFEDIRKNWTLRVWRTQPDQAHPLLTPVDNNRFRAVHDFHGHFMTGRNFDRHGEEAAWARHSSMFTGLARRAMTSETRGQSSAFIWINGGRVFPPQKAVLLPEWVSETP